MKEQRIGYIVGILFTFFILLQIGTGLEPVSPSLLKSALEGAKQAVPDLGAEFEPFQKWLPKRGVVSLLMDEPVGEESVEASRAYRNAQNYLCPLVLTQKPKEPLAIVYCKDRQTAQRRLRETGYRWVAQLDDGKGIAAKT